MNAADPLSLRLEPSARPIVIEHVTVLPMTGGPSLPDHSVLIEAGRIVSVRPSREPIEGALQVDGRGRFLMPGLADMHAHYGDPGQFVMFLANGVTLLRNMWGGPFHLALASSIAKGEFPGPRIFTTSPIVDGIPLYPGNVVLEDPAGAAALIAGFAAAGYDAVKVYSYLEPDCLRALGRAAAEHGLPVIGHCPSGMSFEEAMDAGQTSFEHLVEVGAGHLRDGRSFPAMPSVRTEAAATVASERMALEIDHLDRDAVRRLASEMARRNVWNCPTITVMDKFAKPAGESMDDPDMRYAPAATREYWGRRAAAAAGTDEVMVLRSRHIDLLREITGLLHSEGAPMLLGTDAGSPLTLQGFTIHEELQHLVASGLSTYQALECGTVRPAQHLGMLDDLGTIEPGKLADLVLLEADPLADIAATRQVAAVFSNGYLFDRAELDRLLEWRAVTADEAAVLPANRIGPMATPEWFAR